MSRRTNKPTVEIQRRMQLAGMTDGDGHPRVGRNLDTVAIIRPDVVELDLQRKVLRYDTGGTLVSDIPRPELLDSFIALSDSPDTDIWRFAQAFGVLGVDVFHNNGVYEEAIAEWRHWTARVRAMLGAAASLHQDQPVKGEDWLRLAPPAVEEWTAIFKDRPDLTAAQKRLYIERNCLADSLNQCLQITRVRPCFTWWRTTSGIAFTNLSGIDEGALTLSGALAVQLVLACGRAESISTCSGCHLPYIRRWRSPTGRRNYCEDCGVRAAWRDSKRRRRAETAENQSGSKKRRRGAK